MGRWSGDGDDGLKYGVLGFDDLGFGGMEIWVLMMMGDDEWG